MANYIVSYDLNGPTPSHQTMDKHMETAGWTRGRILETVWYVGTEQSLQQVAGYVNSILSSNDGLIVVQATDFRHKNSLVDGGAVEQAFVDHQ